MAISPATSKLIMKAIEESQCSLLKKYGKEIVDTVEKHALGAAAAGVCAGWVPGVGGTAALVAAAGFIWSMYYKINKLLGISLSKSLLKSLATAVVTNLAAYAASSVIASTVLSLVPGIGSIAATATAAAITFAVTIASGIVYLHVMKKFIGDNTDFSGISEEEMKNRAKESISAQDFGSVIKDAMNAYKEGKKNGTITGEEKVDLEEDEV